MQLAECYGRARAMAMARWPALVWWLQVTAAARNVSGVRPAGPLRRRVVVRSGVWAEQRAPVRMPAALRYPL